MGHRNNDIYISGSYLIIIFMGPPAQSRSPENWAIIIIIAYYRKESADTDNIRINNNGVTCKIERHHYWNLAVFHNLLFKQ